ncbi:hypothetical protein PF010_g30319 [Phytophthora fragariae]|uniref:RxLR effector protein n=1 Tax=Phytophthora fragariae TaxID=53985 RepID=A0A6G0JLJ0_9STRA|nr:hypothetical protein PF010_g30319 [Phytophthora fragariae]
MGIASSKPLKLAIFKVFAFSLTTMGCCGAHSHRVLREPAGSRGGVRPCPVPVSPVPS